MNQCVWQKRMGSFMLLLSLTGWAHADQLLMIADLGIDYGASEIRLSPQELGRLHTRSFLFPDGSRQSWYALNQSCLNSLETPKGATPATRALDPWWSALDRYKTSQTPGKNSFDKKKQEPNKALNIRSVWLEHFPLRCVRDRYLQSLREQSGDNGDDAHADPASDRALGQLVDQAIYQQIYRELGASEDEKKSMRLSVGTSGGVSWVSPGIHLETSSLVAFYKTVAISHGGTSKYTWEDFEDDYELRDGFLSPRYAFFANAFVPTPLVDVLLEAELMSSPSTLSKKAYALSASIGKELSLPDPRWTVALFSGYTFILRDKGFGAATILGLVGRQEAKKYMETFFDPKDVGLSQKGQALSLQAGLGRDLGPLRLQVVLRSLLDVRPRAGNGGRKSVPASLHLKASFDLEKD